MTFDLLIFGTGAFCPFEVLTVLTKGTTSEQHNLDVHKSMHKISKTELKKVNNATWIYVKVCIKSQMLKLELSFAILGLIFAGAAHRLGPDSMLILCVYVCI